MPNDFTLPPDLVTAHAASLRALARSLALDEHAADDVVQETWLRALSSPPARHEGIGGWLRRVAEGFALQRHRSEARRADREKRYARERPEAVTSADTRAETLRAVVEAVLSLEDPYRETVLLRWFEGLPPRDIAVQMRTSVATVNSRLQRAHALLRERLSRRLEIDDRRLQGVLLVIFGADKAPVAAGLASFSLMGVTLTTTKVFLAAGIAAVSLCLLLYLEGGDERAGPLPLAAASGSTQMEGGAVIAANPEVGTRRVELAPEAVATPTETAPAVEPGPFVFDLTVVPIDPDGRPVSGMSVYIGLELQRVARLGETAWNGELHATWRGLEPKLELVLELSGSGTSSAESPLRRIHLTAGAPETVVLAVGPRESVHRDRLRLSAIGYASAETPSLSSAPRAMFARDEAGNGLFQDAWILGPDGSAARADALTGARIDEIRLRASLLTDATSSMRRERARVSLRAERLDQVIHDSAHIEGIVRDEQGKPRPGVLVTALTESDGGRWDSMTDTEGRFAYAVPHGKAIVFAGGGDRALVRETIELVADEVRAFEMQSLPLEMTRVRLLDNEGRPLAGWHLEGRQTDANGMLTGRADTDDAGHAALILPRGPQGLLYARPSGSVLKMRLDARAFDREKGTDVTVRENQQPGLIYVAIHVPHGIPVEARLWRSDSGEGVRMPLLDVAGEDDARNLFRVSGLLPGEYMIEIGAAGTQWKKIGPFFLQPGQELDAGTFTLDEPAHIAVPIEDGTPLPIVTVRARVHGLGLECQSAVARTGALLLTPGEWTLGVKSADKSAPKTLSIPHPIQAAPGERLQVTLHDDLKAH